MTTISEAGDRTIYIIKSQSGYSIFAGRDQTFLTGHGEREASFPEAIEALTNLKDGYFARGPDVRIIGVDEKEARTFISIIERLETTAQALLKPATNSVPLGKADFL